MFESQFFVRTSTPLPLVLPLVPSVLMVDFASAHTLVLRKIRQDTEFISSRASFIIFHDHMWLSVFRVEIAASGPFKRILEGLLELQ